MTVSVDRRTVTPWLDDYAAARRGFDWSSAWNALGGPPGDGGVNIADLAVDRHVRDGRGNVVALRWLPREADGWRHATDITYAELAVRTRPVPSQCGQGRVVASGTPVRRRWRLISIRPKELIRPT